MNKVKTMLAVSALNLFTTAYAGTMGPIATEQKLIRPFVTADAAYTWNSMYPGIINGIQSTEQENGWGGRVAGGFALRHTDDVSFSAEFGWGSYGYSIFKDPEAGEISTKWAISGFDVLLGTIYEYKMLDFYLKAGALFQNLTLTQDQSLALYFPGGLVGGHKGTSGTYAGVLPEVKVGAEYNINDHLAAGVSYMYAFGANRTLFVSNDATDTSITVNSETRFQALTINSIMFGLRYYI